MNLNQNEKTIDRKTVVTVSIFGGILLLLCILLNLEGISKFADSLMGLLRPIIWGLVLSYLINPLFRFFERRCLSKLKPLGLRRAISMTLSYLAFFLIIALVLALLLQNWQ